MSKKDAALVLAIRAMGNSQKLAEKLHIKPQAVSQWKRVPLARVYQVAEVTGISHEDLRPDFFKKKESAA